MTRHATSTRGRRTAARLTLALALSATITCGVWAQEKPKPQVAPAPVAAPAPAVPAVPAEGKPTDILTDRPDFEFDEKIELVGPAFESRGHGISLRPPKDAIPVRRVGSKDIIEFVDEAKGWTLKLSKIMLDKPGGLANVRDARGQVEPGMLEFTAKRLKEELPDAEFMRQEVINIADGDVGMLALRYTRNLKPLLSQQAIIQKTDQLYYLLALTTPGVPKGSNDANAAAGERLAVETFRQVLDSVKLLDLAAVRQDQDARLFRTRTLLVNFKPERFKKALLSEQWLRILKNGKDVGYTKIEETTTVKGAQEGIEVRLRSRARAGADTQVDVGSILFASMDLRHEDWSTLSEFANLKQKAADKNYKAPQITENGVSDRRPVPGRGDAYSLQVLFESTKERVEPITRDLPPFYLPQAVSHLLPRLLPLGEPKTYMFMVYVSDTREVVMRYVDVKPMAKVRFNNELIRAVPVEDRLGLEGSLTTHYMSPEGEWLGSENKEQQLTVIPSDSQKLMSLWKDDLALPEPGANAADGQAAGQDAKSSDAPKPRQTNVSDAPARRQSPPEPRTGARQ